MKSKHLRGLVFCLLTLALGSEAQARPEVKVELKPSRSVKQGGICELTVQATWPTAEADYQFQIPTLPLENMSISETGESSESLQKGTEQWKLKTFHFRLRPVKVGQATVGGFNLRYVDQATQSAGSVSVSPLSIKVIPEWSRIQRFLFSIFIGSVVIALMVGGFWMIARQSRRSEKPIAPPSCAEERHLVELRSLDNALGQGVMDEKMLAQASKVFRSYLREKLSMAPVKLTNHELLEATKRHFEREDMAELRTILERFDTLSYAGGDRGILTSDGEQFLKRAIRFIEGKQAILPHN